MFEVFVQQTVITSDPPRETRTPRSVLVVELNGPDFCRAFRKLYPNDYSYFILLTSKSEKNDIANGLDSGADDFLTKPVNAPELRADYGG